MHIFFTKQGSMKSGRYGHSTSKNHRVIDSNPAPGRVILTPQIPEKEKNRNNLLLKKIVRTSNFKEPIDEDIHLIVGAELPEYKNLNQLKTRKVLSPEEVQVKKIVSDQFEDVSSTKIVRPPVITPSKINTEVKILTNTLVDLNNVKTGSNIGTNSQPQENLTNHPSYTLKKTVEERIAEAIAKQKVNT